MKNGAKYLAECGLRPSMQRLAIYQYMATHPTHPTADEIFEALKEQMPTLSKTTVYNTLKLFVAHGVVDEVFIDRTSERFDGNTELHAHFLCSNCGAIIDTPIASPESVNSAAPEGVSLAKTQLLYFGTCTKCIENQLNNN